ncbi:MAG: 4-(cytidine 5'-diphospho)-2-C-methyl-D-erythritol kinase [Hyphomicrobiaceae bacterium]
MVQSGSAGASLTEMAPAKINLTLTVCGRRRDGYHQLESLVVFADSAASDTIDLVVGGPLHLELLGPGAAALAGEAISSNLVMRAAVAVLQMVPRAETGTFRLQKHLPVAAGIGSGSADAAAALRLMRRANPNLADSIDWASLAATIGADVPVCLANRASLMWGLGERVAPLLELPAVWVVLANPRVPLSTADVFRTLSASSLPFDQEAAETLPTIPRFANLADLITFITRRPNDLEAPAKQLCPIIREVQLRLADLDGALLARMSGSGPTCFALFATANAAHDGARRLAVSRPDWWVQAAGVV